MRLVAPGEAGSLAAAEDDAADVGMVSDPYKMSSSAARSVVEVLTGISVVEAMSWLAGGTEVPGALLEEGYSRLNKAGPVALFCGALFELPGDIVDAAPDNIEAEEVAEDETMLKGVPEIGTALQFPLPGTHPRTISAAVAEQGPR